MMIRRDFPDSRDQDLPFPDFCARKTQARLSRLRWMQRDQVAQETARLRSAISRPSRPRCRRRDFPDQGGDGATENQFFATKAETAGFSRPRKDGATFQIRAERARVFRPKRRRRDFPDQGGDGAT